MSKLKLIAQVLSADLKRDDIDETARRQQIETAIREYAIDVLNKYNFFREKNIEDNTLKELMQMEDLDFNLKTRKFF
jgi:hypothetical protein